MLPLILAAAALAASLFVYVGRERLGAAGVGMAALRTAGLAALVLLLVNPVAVRRVSGGPPTVLLDASLSMGAAGGRWREALDTARALAGARGAIIRFGEGVEPFDTAPPAAAASRLRAALAAGLARGGPVVVVTDGELHDAASVPPAMLGEASFVLLPRDTVANVALLDVDVPERLAREDSLVLSVSVGAWGALPERSATLEVWTGARRLAARAIELPPPPGAGRRRVALPPGALAPGVHVLRIRVAAPGDVEPGDDERLRVVEVSAQPAVVVVVDPADWEGRFLVRELSEVARTTVRGYARVGAEQWLDMRTLEPAAPQAVRAAVAGAGLVVLRGGRDVAPGRRTPVWRWPAGTGGSATQFFPGDWYVNGDVGASPLAARLAAVPWDSLPPLTGLVPLVAGEDEWVALRARQGRRGAARPVVVGTEAAGRRELTTAGTGAWRWAFRGGASREAYRSLLAAGVEWLLERGASVAGPLDADRVVSRGAPVTFRWRAGDPPDSLAVRLTTAPGERTVTLRFAADGMAEVPLPPGVYRWAAAALPAAAVGVTVVEAYSAEIPPAPVAALAGAGGAGTTLAVRDARAAWWLYAAVVLALLGEWAWRQRRGLP